MKYKKSYIVINSILFLVELFLIINLFFFKHSSYLFCIFSLLIPFLSITFIYGFEKKRRRFMYELIFYVFAISIIFVLITYIIGIFTGFEQNVYKLNFSNLIHNIIPYFILILICELFRYEITRKGDGSPLSYVLITVIMVLIDMTIFYKTYNLDVGEEQIKYICSIMLPSVFKNVILIYFTKWGGYYPSLVYRIIFDLKLVIVPIIPNFGLYFECTINCILPVLICSLVEVNLRKFRNRSVEKRNIKENFIYRYLFFFVTILIAVGINLLSSGKLKYTMIAIGSGSMTPNICKGDVVIYERLSDSIKLEIGDILIFRKDVKVVVHRIIKIVDIGDNEYVYYTKGDANESPDGYPIPVSDILGVARRRIKYIGIPSVYLGELIKSKG